MLLVTTSDKLELQSLPGHKTSQIIFRNKILTRGPDFAAKLWQTAKQYCERYYDPNRLCVLVEHSSYVSVWKENNEMPTDVREKKTQVLALETQQPIQIELNDESIARCKQELAEFIGPISSIVCDQILAENPNIKIQEFIKAIAKQVPDKDKADEFELRFIDWL